MPQAFQVQPQSGKTAGTTVASVDSSGNEVIAGSITVASGVILQKQPSAPASVPGALVLYSPDGVSLATVGAALLPSSLLLSGGLSVHEGANARMGTATLVAGAAVVANTSVTANTRIFLTSQVDGGTPGFLRVSTRTAGTSFTITSSSAVDTSTVAYLLVEPN